MLTPTVAAQPTASLYAIELRTLQWDMMVLWYRDVLRLRVLVRVMEDRFALLSLGDARLAIVGQQKKQPASPRVSLAFEVDDLDHFSRRLAAADAPITRRRAAEGYEEIITQDLDGNPLRLFAWPPQNDG